ncbi:hypothetical protein [Acinetobacter tianfuensis]|uniref:Apea-like HEPN domain-containing protein n=1 Tax=Acinetobacter tianfuensis TaxID=2419603 RepID=A0A3A8EY04_9GAMM|nr:hypothetical protein [Acinetobacter tianfuensis]RKG33741.1 hypothetical protein D7V32_02770 [Acinetobacter tianfuensis]
MTINQSTSVSAEFGYYPERIEIENDRFSIKTLPNFEDVLAAVKDDPNIHKDWIYPGTQKNIDLNGVITHRPYSVRIFGMPKTHEITLHRSDNIEDIDFVVWCLSFFTGMRLSKDKYGFLDATPIKKGKLVDFVLSQCTIEDVIELTLDYLESERDNFRATKRVSAVIHALFLAQYPQSLPFERFQYLYMALDGCYQLVKAKANPKLKKDISHKNRIEWICNQFQIKVPDWALVIEKKSEISIVRNDTMHEALFLDEPLGFAIYINNQPDGKQINVILEMQHLLCRLLVCILGKAETDYVKSCINNRLLKCLTL